MGKTTGVGTANTSEMVSASWVKGNVGMEDMFKPQLILAVTAPDGNVRFVKSNTTPITGVLQGMKFIKRKTSEKLTCNFPGC